MGGAIGAGARYLVNAAALYWLGPGFPWGTLAVNLIGSFLMGMLAHLLVTGAMSHMPVGARLLLMTGLLGGFTTFSAYALDVVMLAERGHMTWALFYGTGSAAGAIAALLAGQWLMRSLTG